MKKELSIELINQIKVAGGEIEYESIDTVEPCVIFTFNNSRYSVSSTESMVFSECNIEKNYFKTIKEFNHDESEYKDLCDYVTNWLKAESFSALQEEWYEKFLEYVTSLKERGLITDIMEVIARDNAWDMTEGWSEMDVDTVKLFLENEKEYIEALQETESILRESETEIDLNDMHEVNDVSMEYSAGYLIDIFYSKI